MWWAEVSKQNSRLRICLEKALSSILSGEASDAVTTRMTSHGHIPPASIPRQLP